MALGGITGCDSGATTSPSPIVDLWTAPNGGRDLVIRGSPNALSLEQIIKFQIEKCGMSVQQATGTVGENTEKCVKDLGGKSEKSLL